MEHTEGFASKAEVLVNGESLIVCDGVSAPRRRCAPGILEGVKFGYPSLEGFDWNQAVRGNPGEKRRLDHVRGWSYVGFGRVVSIMPVRIDFGMLEMEDPNWSDDEKLIGKYVRVSIDRLELNAVSDDQWPEELM